MSKASRTQRMLQPSFSPRLVFADFDNDKNLDGALLFEGGLVDGKRTFRVEIHVSAGENGNLVFASDDGALGIRVLDVNRNGSTDLVVEHTVTHKWVRVWFNDGRGHFRQARAGEYKQITDPAQMWRAEDPYVAHLVPALPTRTGTQSANLPGKIAYFGTSPSIWKTRPQSSGIQIVSARAMSPRAPPTPLSL